MNVTLIADASYCPDEHVAGFGFWIASQRGKLGGGGKCDLGKYVQNSTVAEMMAITHSIYLGIEANLVQPGDNVLVQTDCVAAIQAFSLTRFSLANQEREALKYMQQVQKTLGLELRYRHVKGHTTLDDARSITNRMCDKRAKEFMRIARTQSKAQKLKQFILQGPNYVVDTPH